MDFMDKIYHYNSKKKDLEKLIKDFNTEINEKYKSALEILVERNLIELKEYWEDIQNLNLVNLKKLEKSKEKI